MLFCEYCGECNLLNEDCEFHETRYTSGWEVNVVDAEDGTYVDMIDSESSDEGHDCYRCLNCDNSNVTNDWDGNREEAQSVRDTYNTLITARNIEREKRLYAEEASKRATDPAREWDIKENLEV